MIVSEIRLDGDTEIQLRLKELKDRAPQALYRAINDAVSKTFTEEKRAAAGKYNIAQKNVAPTLRKVKASRSRLKGGVISTGERISLYDFKHSAGNPIKVSVKKGGSSKSLDGDPKAFIAEMKNGHIGIFERKRDYKKKIKKRKLGVKEGINRHNVRIKQLNSLSVPQMLKDEKLMGQVEDKARDVLMERLEHHIEYILRKG